MRFLLVPLAVAAMVTASCGGGTDRVATPEQAPLTAGPTTSPAPTTVVPGAPQPQGAVALRAPVADALQFSAAAVNGSQVVGADYAGKDVALWFWAPW
ncbi:MAG: hypothetical protein ABIS21_07665 [Acidimicrobiales bacterium]